MGVCEGLVGCCCLPGWVGFCGCFWAYEYRGAWELSGFYLAVWVLSSSVGGGFEFDGFVVVGL